MQQPCIKTYLGLNQAADCRRDLEKYIFVSPLCCSLRTRCSQNPCPGPEALAHLAALIRCTGHRRHMTQEFDSSQAFPQGCCESNPHQLGQPPRESQEQSVIQESQPNT